MVHSEGKVYVWRKPGDEYLDKCLVPTVKHGGGNVKLQGCMSSVGTEDVKFIDGTMDRFVYKDILEKHMFPSARRLVGWSFH